ncbi:MAG: biotin--[acetyl-CoA-carboxylase] ligase [Ruminococcaceae bacterium]|nr:biotin--[acetyl-CoA-carboxylase] ligase [Oscillospiraceae bacterium]
MSFEKCDFLSKTQIEKYLKGKAKKVSLQIYDTVGSTNDIVKQEALQGAEEGLTVIALHQTDGRGSKGRSFFSPAYSGIYMSILLKPDLSEKVGLITSLAGVCVCEATKKLSDKNAKIKWVNDIFIDNKKVCGILTEGVYSKDNTFAYAVLGIGINVYSPKDSFPDELKDIAGAVFERETPDTKNKLVAEILNLFFEKYHEFSKKEICRQYKEKSLVIGKEITFTEQEKTSRALALDIDENCGLVVKLKNGQIKTLTSGQISIRKEKL